VPYGVHAARLLRWRRRRYVPIVLAIRFVYVRARRFYSNVTTFEYVEVWRFATSRQDNEPVEDDVHDASYWSPNVVSGTRAAQRDAVMLLLMSVGRVDAVDRHYPPPTRQANWYSYTCFKLFVAGQYNPL